MASSNRRSRKHALGAGWDEVSKHQLSVKDMSSRSRSQEQIFKTRSPRQHHIEFKPVVVVQPRDPRVPEVGTTLTRQVARRSSNSMNAMGTPAAEPQVNFGVAPSVRRPQSMTTPSCIVRPWHAVDVMMRPCEKGKPVRVTT